VSARALLREFHKGYLFLLACHPLWLLLKGFFLGASPIGLLLIPEYKKEGTSGKKKMAAASGALLTTARGTRAGDEEFEAPTRRIIYHD